MCETIIKKEFGLDISVAIISASDFIHAIEHAPLWWNSDENAKHNAIFVIAPATAQSVLFDIGQTKPEYEQISFCGPVLFWSAPLQTFSRTRLSKVVSTSTYNDVTIRNANTAYKLAELLKGED